MKIKINRTSHSVSNLLEVLGTTTPLTAFFMYIGIGWISFTLCSNLLHQVDARLAEVFAGMGYTNFFFQHCLVFVLSILSIMKFGEILLAFRKNRDSTFFYLALIFGFQILGFALFFISPSTTLCLSITFFVIFNAMLREFLERCRIAYNSFNHYIDLVSAARLDKNLKVHGYNIVEMLTDNDGLKFIISCSKESFDNLHAINTMYGRGDNTTRFMIDFLLKRKIAIDENCNFVNEDGTLMDSKHFLKTYYEYVKDYKDLHAVKDFFEQENTKQ